MSSRIASWLLWKRLALTVLAKYPEYVFPQPYWKWRNATGEICPICDGFGIATMDNEDYDCVCQVLMWQDQVKAALDPLRSQHGSVADIHLDMTNKKFADGINKAMFWATEPVGVMVISGAYGCGKTHILQSINELLTPIALYITASDFEQKIFQHLGDSSLQSFIRGVSLAPILLFDDLGMEYGSDIVNTQLVHVIDSRYRNLSLFPMAVATNKESTEIMYIDRIGSRLMQEQTLTWVSLKGVPDYRIRRAK